MKDLFRILCAVLSTESFTETTTEQGVTAVENGQPVIAAMFRRFIDAFVTDWIHVCQYVTGKRQHDVMTCRLHGSGPAEE